MSHAADTESNAPPITTELLGSSLSPPPTGGSTSPEKGSADRGPIAPRSTSVDTDSTAHSEPLTKPARGKRKAKNFAARNKASKRQKVEVLREDEDMKSAPGSITRTAIASSSNRQTLKSRKSAEADETFISDEIIADTMASRRKTPESIESEAEEEEDPYPAATLGELDPHMAICLN